MACKAPKYRKNAGTVVACGQCGPCLLKKVREKQARVLLEDRSATQDPLFVTLSYDDMHLPTWYLHESVDRETGVVTETLYQCETGTLNPPDLVNFLKRLRYHAGKKDLKIRAVYAGEYGDLKKRPHYHLIVWGIPYKHRELFFRAWVDEQKVPMCDPRRLDVQIPKSKLHVARYCAKYIIGGKNKKDSSILNGAYPEFYRTSKGLGLQYAEGIANALKKDSGLQNLWIDGKLPSSFIFDGKNYPLDRYMRQKIYEKLPNVFKEELQKAALENYKAEVQTLYENALLDPAFQEETQDMKYEDILELVVTRKNAQRASDIEMRHSFFTSKRKNLDV
nr:MAG: replication initiator protein [Microvirus sp.]